MRRLLRLRERCLEDSGWSTLMAVEVLGCLRCISEGCACVGWVVGGWQTVCGG